jgi:hypothetical protein
MRRSPGGPPDRRRVEGSAERGVGRSGTPGDDDWTGEPPEGRYSRDRAQPGFWANQWQPLAIGGGVLMILVIVVLILALA